MTTLKDFLSQLHTDPLDETSPTLIVAVGDTTDKQDALITGAWYGRAPYAVIESLPANVERSLAGGHAFMRQLVDVTLVHSPTATNEKPALDAILTLWHYVRAAPLYVTEHRHGEEMVTGSLTREVLVAPFDDPERPNGLLATVRFRIKFTI